MHTLAKNVQFVGLIPKKWTDFYGCQTTTSNFFGSTQTVIRDEDDMSGIDYHIKLAKLLIEKGADLHIKNVKGETPLLTAMKNEHYHLAATLIEADSKFWIETDKSGANFFHHYGYLIARLGEFQPHTAEDAIIQERFISIAKRIWNIVESKLTDEIDLKGIVS